MKKIVFLGLILTLLLISGCEKEEFKLVPKENTVNPKLVANTAASTGWSANTNPEDAVKEAVAMASKNREKTESPHFAMIFATSGSDINKIVSSARTLLGKETKIYGGSSDSRGVITDKGFIKTSEIGYTENSTEGRRALAVMLIYSDEIIFGVGSADFSKNSSASEAGKSAITSAIYDAGKTKEDLPNLILSLITIGKEDVVLEGIEEVVSKDAIILGGTAGGPEMTVFANDKLHKEGVSLAVIYTNLSISWTFEAGFDVKESHSGIATKINGQAIEEINNRPALDVYNEWLDGEVDRLYAEVGKPDKIRDLLTLRPLYRKYLTSDGKTHLLFSHPWPRDKTLQDRAIMTSTIIKEGERMYLSYGTWETLLNRIGNLPKRAREYMLNAEDITPLFSLGFVCAGVMGTIPETERANIPILINYANEYIPFIVPITWGEQGHYPKLGNRHGNLQTSFIIVGKKN